MVDRAATSDGASLPRARSRRRRERRSGPSPSSVGRLTPMPPTHLQPTSLPSLSSNASRRSLPRRSMTPPDRRHRRHVVLDPGYHLIVGAASGFYLQSRHDQPQLRQGTAGEGVVLTPPTAVPATHRAPSTTAAGALVLVTPPTPSPRRPPLPPIAPVLPSCPRRRDPPRSRKRAGSASCPRAPRRADAESNAIARQQRCVLTGRSRRRRSPKKTPDNNAVRRKAIRRAASKKAVAGNRRQESGRQG